LLILFHWFFTGFRQTSKPFPDNGQEGSWPFWLFLVAAREGSRTHPKPDRNAAMDLEASMNFKAIPASSAATRKPIALRR
jgi:hypothetical protein